MITPEFRKSKILYTAEPRNSFRTSGRLIKRPGALLALILIVVFLSGLTYLSRLERFRVQEIEISGAETLSADGIRSLISDAIKGEALFFIPRDNIFILSGEKLEHALREEFPKIAEVSVNRRPPSTLAVDVTERELWGIGCVKTETEEIVEGGAENKSATREAVGPCFYIDRGGFAFEDVTSFEGGLLPILYKEGTGRVGSELFSAEDVRIFQKTDSILEDKLQLPLLSVDFSSEDGEDVRLALKEGWKVIVPREEEASTWVAVLRTLLTEEIKERRNRLDYVDLRFGSKVFYKYR